MPYEPPQIIVLPSEQGAPPPKRKLPWTRISAVILLTFFLAGEGFLLWETWAEQQALRQQVTTDASRIDALRRELDATREAQDRSQEDLTALQEGLEHAENLARSATDTATVQLQQLQQQLATLRASSGGRTASLQQTRTAIEGAVLPVACGAYYRGEFYVVGTGSGTVLTPDGLLLTNHHVIETDDVEDPSPGETLMCAALVEDEGGADALYALVYVRGDYEDDIAILKMIPTDEGQQPPSNLPSLAGAAIPLCSDDDVVVTKQLIVLGYPAYGTSEDEIPTTLTTTMGTVSQEERDGYVATDAKIDHGNSGGAAILESGCFLGIPTAISEKENGMTESLGYILRVKSLGVL